MHSAPASERKSHWRHLPNAITLARIAAVGPLAYLLANFRYEAALWLTFVAGASDALDGYLAKRFDWHTALGGMLDPLADKLLLVVCYMMFGFNEVLPWWLFWLVVGRDAVIIAGATAYHNLVAPVSSEPTLLSKLNTFMQISLVLWMLLALTWLDGFGWLSELLIWVVTATTVGSGLQYVWIWGRRAIRTGAKTAKG